MKKQIGVLLLFSLFAAVYFPLTYVFVFKNYLNLDHSFKQLFLMDFHDEHNFQKVYKNSRNLIDSNDRHLSLRFNENNRNFSEKMAKIWTPKPIEKLDRSLLTQAKKINGVCLT